MSERFVVGHDEEIGRDDYAGMPKEVYMKEYPKSRMGRDFKIDDTMVDIDDVEDDSVSKRDRYVSHQK